MPRNRRRNRPGGSGHPHQPHHDTQSVNVMVFHNGVQVPTSAEWPYGVGMELTYFWQPVLGVWLPSVRPIQEPAPPPNQPPPQHQGTGRRPNRSRNRNRQRQRARAQAQQQPHPSPSAPVTGQKQDPEPTPAPVFATATAAAAAPAPQPASKPDPNNIKREPAMDTCPYPESRAGQHAGTKVKVEKNAAHGFGGGFGGNRERVVKEKVGEWTDVKIKIERD